MTHVLQMKPTAANLCPVLIRGMKVAGKLLLRDDDHPLLLLAPNVDCSSPLDMVLVKPPM